MGKYKKNTEIQSVLFLYFICMFLYFYQKKYGKNTKKIRMQLLKNTKYKKNTNQQFQKYKKQKKYEPKISKIQNTKKRQIQK